MKKGLLIVFCNDAHLIEKYDFKNIFKQKNMKFCLVNNGSSDKTLQYLRNLKNETNSELHILDIKKNKGVIKAIKAGARYLFNTEELNIIFHINSNLLFFMKDLKKRIDFLKTSKTDELLRNPSRRKTLKKVVSIKNFLLF